MLLTIFNMLGVVEEALAMILAIVAVVVLLYVFVSMYSATLERRREIATMRALGARRATDPGHRPAGIGRARRGRRHRRDRRRTRRRVLSARSLLAARGGLVAPPFAVRRRSSR